MSTFAVTVEQIDKILSHPDADRLVLATLGGMTFQFCVMKDQYKEGDLVVYFPVDSLLPVELIEKIGLTGRLSGKDKNRVKTIKLRGQISQGVVARPEDILEIPVALGADVTEVLGVTKYEPLELNIRNGRLVPLPQLVQMYDIEGADRFPDVVEMLMDEKVVITEKVEGSHFSASYYADGDFAICQRRYRILPEEDALHDWHKAAQDIGLESIMRSVFVTHGVKHVLTFRGEMLGPGIQDNIYGLSKRKIVFFEIEVDGIPASVSSTIRLFMRLGLESVPVVGVGILRKLLAGKTVKEYSTANTILYGAKDPDKTLREGIVIRPVRERHDVNFGRVIIKQRSPEYLEWSGL